MAVKVLPESLASDAERLARFQREAKTLASLNHPQHRAIYGLEESGGMTALVMELVEGDDLSQRIARGAIPIDEALPIAKQIAEALEAAHEQGIIHRDLKPANIKVRPDGAVKVLDFGLAKALEPTDAMSPGMSQAPTITTPAMTQAGMILGTAAYMSPEQAKGRAVDKRSDVWAFGAVFYEMLAGRRAFQGDGVSETLAKVIEREPDFNALPAGVPARVRQALAVCLRKDQKQRASDIHDVRLALEGAFESGVSQGVGPLAVTPPVSRRVMPWVAAIVLAAVSGAGVWLLRPVEPRPVNRSQHLLPEGRGFRDPNRPVLAMSPDGRSFVYNGTGGLYLHSMDALEDRLIPGTEAQLSNPAFSPDGAWLAFRTAAPNQLQKIAVVGGAPVPLTDLESSTSSQ